MDHLPTMDWDFKDQLAHVVKSGGGDVYFTYDASGQRVRKVWVHSGITEERIYLGGFEIYRRHQSNSVVLERETLHIMDDTRRIAMVETKTIDADVPNLTPTPRMRFQCSNHLGSAMLEVDEFGLVISYEEYHPYGTSAYRAVDGSVEVSAKRYRYTGKERDEETGLYYHGARYYACWLGRWTSADPAGMVDGVNLYVYCRHNPISHHDPNGHQDVQIPDLMAEFSRGLGKVIEFFVGGKTETVGSGANGVVYQPSSIPYGGGVAGGIVQAATLRIWPQEPNPTPASRSGMDAGAGLVPVLDPAARVATGRTVSGASASRTMAAGELVLQLVPVAAEASAVIPKTPTVPDIEKQLIDALRAGTAQHPSVLPPEVQRFLPQAAQFSAARKAPPGGEGVVGMAESAGGGTPPGFLFRGTTEGYPGNPALQKIGITPTTTDPAVATLFATEASQHGQGVVLIAPRAGLPVGEPNVLATIEREVAVELLPSEFAARATGVNVADARAALTRVGINLPSKVTKGSLSSDLTHVPKMTDSEIMQFLKQVGF